MNEAQRQQKKLDAAAQGFKATKFNGHNLGPLQSLGWTLVPQGQGAHIPQSSLGHSIDPARLERGHISLPLNHEARMAIRAFYTGGIFEKITAVVPCGTSTPEKLIATMRTDGSPTVEISF